jgi:hypothetical protein
MAGATVCARGGSARSLGSSGRRGRCGGARGSYDFRPAGAGDSARVGAAPGATT